VKPLAYIGIRRVPAQTERMGTHGRKTQPTPLPDRRLLQGIQIHCWAVAGRTMISCVGVYQVDGDVERHNLGADILDYNAFDLPGLMQTVYAIGDEIRAGARELTHPKR
jgi:hypothetical protein